jgi:uncharacterized membrane protein
VRVWISIVAAQAATLLLFNEAEELSYGEVQERLNLQVWRVAFMSYWLVGLQLMCMVA